jgi:cyclic pyranopterin phosphate synthase
MVGATRAAPKLVRLSITDRCDLACVYCRPNRRDGYLPSERRLRAEHWESLVRGLVRRGVERVRITGGEPLVHPEVVEIVARIAAIPGVRDVALTTNGTRLRELAGPLREAGLGRVNVSIDSLIPERFWQITRGGRLEDVLAGVEAARVAGLAELKTNTVVVAVDPRDPGSVGNEDELASIARWAWSVGATPRFLELMSIGEGAQVRGRFVPYAAMRAKLAPLLEDEPTVRPADRGPARYARARAGGETDSDGRAIGFITGSSDTFCDGCDRLRVTSDGALRPCLATSDAVDVQEAIAEGDVEAIAEGLDRAWAQKPDGVVWKGCTEETAAHVSMRATGG